MPTKIICPLCADSSVSVQRTVGITPVLQCRSCAMTFMTAGGTETNYASQYFRQEGGRAGYENYEAEFPAHYRSFQDRLRHTEKLLQRKGRLLDVGCALGHCGKAALDAGWDTYVTDISPFAVKRAHQKFGLKAFVSPKGKLPVFEAAFDCVTLFDVLEHVTTPVPLLKEIRHALHPAGVLHVSTPNVNSWSARFMGALWYHYKPDEHFLYFSPHTLRRALEASGFTVDRIEPLPMSMRIGDVVRRLKRYWPWGFGTALRLLQWLHLSDKVVVLYAGEMQAWARPSGGPFAALLETPSELSDVCACPSCSGRLSLTQDAAQCLVCLTRYPIDEGVLDFSQAEPQSLRQTKA